LLLVGLRPDAVAELSIQHSRDLRGGISDFRQRLEVLVQESRRTTSSFAANEPGLLSDTLMGIESERRKQVGVTCSKFELLMPRVGLSQESPIVLTHSLDYFL
jgi:hypothetical protein